MWQILSIEFMQTIRFMYLAMCNERFGRFVCLSVVFFVLTNQMAICMTPTILDNINVVIFHLAMVGTLFFFRYSILLADNYSITLTIFA